MCPQSATHFQNSFNYTQIKLALSKWDKRRSLIKILLKAMFSERNINGIATCKYRIDCVGNIVDIVPYIDDIPDTVYSVCIFDNTIIMCVKTVPCIKSTNTKELRGTTQTYNIIDTKEGSTGKLWRAIQDIQLSRWWPWLSAWSKGFDPFHCPMINMIFFACPVPLSIVNTNINAMEHAQFWKDRSKQEILVGLFSHVSRQQFARQQLVPHGILSLRLNEFLYNFVYLPATY